MTVLTNEVKPSYLPLVLFLPPRSSHKSLGMLGSTVFKKLKSLSVSQWSPKEFSGAAKNMVYAVVIHLYNTV